MSRLFAALIRHGDYCQKANTPSAFQLSPLNADGVDQSAAAGDTLHAILSEENWQLSPQLHCSSLLRAWQTAEVISRRLGELQRAPVQLISTDALPERSVGGAANLSIAEIEQVIRDDPRFESLPPAWKSDSHFRLPFPGAESLLEAGERVAAYLKRQMQALAETAPDADTLQLFVGHGAAFRHAAYHLGVLQFDEIAKLSMFHAAPVILEFTVPDQWRHVRGDWKVRAARTEYTD